MAGLDVSDESLSKLGKERRCRGRDYPHFSFCECRSKRPFHLEGGAQIAEPPVPLFWNGIGRDLAGSRLRTTLYGRRLFKKRSRF